MARTKQAARKNLAGKPVATGPNAIDNVAIKTESDVAIKNESDDEDEAGGVTLDMYDLSTQEMIQIYHQTQVPLDPADYPNGLWQVPYGLFDGDRNSEPFKTHFAHPIGKLYHKACTVFKGQWKLPPEHVLPEPMRKFTPYSLALFLAVRRVASHSKQHPEIGEKLLMDAWRDRLQRQSLTPSNFPSGLKIERQLVDLRLSGTQRLEEVIQETNYGLTLADVAEARAKAVNTMNRQTDRLQVQQTKREKRAEQKKMNQALRKLGLDSGISKKSSKQQRKEEARAREKLVGPKGDKLLQFLQEGDGAALDLDSGDYVNGPTEAGAAPPNSPDNTTNGMLALDLPMRDANTNPFQSLSQASMNDGLAGMPDQNGGFQRPPKPTGTDRHNDKMLSDVFNKVNFHDKHKVSAKKAKHLQAGGASRAVVEGALDRRTLDFLNFAGIPTLYTKAGERHMEEALEGLGKMGLKQENKEQEQEGGAEDEGGVSLGITGAVKMEDEDEEL